MNLHYSVPKHSSHAALWLTAAALLLVSLLLVLRADGQPVLVQLDQPSNLSTIQSLPQALPIPEPPHDQPALDPQASATPVPSAAQLRPAPQPVPTPPASK